MSIQNAQTIKAAIRGAIELVEAGTVSSLDEAPMLARGYAKPPRSAPLAFRAGYLLRRDQCLATTAVRQAVDYLGPTFADNPSGWVRTLRFVLERLESWDEDEMIAAVLGGPHRVILSDAWKERLAAREQWTLRAHASAQ